MIPKRNSRNAFAAFRLFFVIPSYTPGAAGKKKALDRSAEEAYHDS